TGTTTLTAGRHQVTLGYYQGGGGLGLIAKYSGPDTGNSLATIPNAVLYQAATGNASAAISNAVAVSANSTINVTGTTTASIGGLTIGANTLNVTNTDNVATPYSLTVNGTTTLTGNATFNVSNAAGGGTGTLTLAAVTDNGGNRNVSFTGAGVVVLNGPGIYG